MFECTVLSDTIHLTACKFATPQAPGQNGLTILPVGGGDIDALALDFGPLKRIYSTRKHTYIWNFSSTYILVCTRVARK